MEGNPCPFGRTAEGKRHSCCRRSSSCSSARHSQSRIQPRTAGTPAKPLTKSMKVCTECFLGQNPTLFFAALGKHKHSLPNKGAPRPERSRKAQGRGIISGWEPAAHQPGERLNCSIDLSRWSKSPKNTCSGCAVGEARSCTARDRMFSLWGQETPPAALSLPSALAAPARTPPPLPSFPHVHIQHRVRLCHGGSVFFLSTPKRISILSVNHRPGPVFQCR